MKPINDIETKYKNIKAKAYARRQRFIQRKKELGCTHISSLWVHLDPVNTEILKESLKKASTKQLLYVVDFLSDTSNENNGEDKKLSTKTLLENELIKYIHLNEDNKTTESLSELSIRLMKMGISTRSRKTNKKTKFSTGSLSRMIKNINKSRLLKTYSQQKTI